MDSMLHNLTEISDARQFCKMMGYSPYFEQGKPTSF